MPFIGEVSMTIPPSQVENPAMLCGATSDGHREPLAAGELDRPNDVGGAGAADDQRGVPVVGGVPDRAGLVVVGVGGSYQLAP